jgi:type I restriction enzyme S subunit
VGEQREIPVQRLPLRWFTARELERARVELGDVIVVSSGYIGKSGCLVDQPDERPVIASNFVRRLRPRADVDGQWLYHLLGMPAAIRAMLRNSGGTTIINLSGGYLDDFKVWRPRLDEQRRIARVLATAHDAIRETQRVVEKLEQMRTGLRLDLLTLGIGADGELRNPQLAPDGFQESPIGLIPRDWSVVPLGEVLADGPRNGVYKAAAVIGRGALMVGQLAFTQDDSVNFARARRAVSSAAELEIFGLREGDLLVTRVFATRLGVGRSILVPAVPEPALYESNMMRLRLETGVMRPEILFIWLKTPIARRLIEAAAYSSNQTSINQRALKALPCLRPPIDEQDAIIERLRAHEDAIHQERETLRKLTLLKAASDADLLTGRVRTTDVASLTETAA